MDDNFQSPHEKNQNFHPLGEFEDHLRSFRPRAPRLDVESELFSCAKTLPKSITFAPPLPARSHWAGWLVGSWICGAAIGAIAMFIVMRGRPNTADSSQFETPIPVSSEAQYAIRTPQYPQQFNSRVPDEAFLPRDIEVRENNASNGFIENFIGSRNLMLNDPQLAAGSFLLRDTTFNSNSRLLSADLGSSQSDRLNSSEKSDSSAGGVRDAEIVPPPLSTRKSLQRELLNSNSLYVF